MKSFAEHQSNLTFQFSFLLD